jgi:hypothetical protein
VTWGCCLGRLALVDELDAALEVEPEAGGLGADDGDGPGDEAENQQQDEEVAAAIRHGLRGKVVPRTLSVVLTLTA